MSDERAACLQCGASGRFGTCTELFHRLLALDHERRQPWGVFHGLNLVCFLLQHPEQSSATDTAGQWQLLTAYVSGGLEALHHLESQRVQAGRRGDRPWIGIEPAPPRISSPRDHDRGVTIEDVSVDGSFPAPGYADRMAAWATAISLERVPDDAVRRFAGDLTDGDPLPD